MSPSIEAVIADLLHRNGLVEVRTTSEAVGRLLTESPGSIDHVDQLAKAVDRQLAAVSGKSRKTIAALIQAQIPPGAVPSAPRIESGDSTPSAVVFVATDLEYANVLDRLVEVKGGLTRSGHWVSTGLSPLGFYVAVVKTGQGNVAAGAVASAVLSEIRPRFAIFSGIAGGLHDQATGTVVIATYVHDYESAEAGASKRSRAKSIEVQHRVQQISGALARRGVDGVVQIDVRPIASGEKLVTETRSETAEWIGLIGSDAAVVEMEGLGVMRAASTIGIPATVVRSVSDRGVDKTPENDATNQPIAASAAARVALSLVDLYLTETAKE